MFYPVAGQLGTRIGVEATALWLGGGIVIFTVLAAVIWPREEAEALSHVHEHVTHEHEHTHGTHHSHEHDEHSDDSGGDESHSHAHRHDKISHTHTFVIDDHHVAWPAENT